MVDRDGRSAYSNTVSLNIEKGVGGFTLNMYPNPVNAGSSAAIRLTSDKPQKLMLRLISPNGVLLSTKYVVLQSGDTNINMADVKNKPAGIYSVEVISLETNQSIGVTRFVVR
jgi:hypothetical protein